MNETQIELRHRGGRPLKFKTLVELQSMIDAYFASTPPEEVTITGLALALDTSRETLMDYENRDGFSDTIKRAKLRVQLEYEKDLRRKGRSGDIFALKNFGWSDRQQYEHNVNAVTFEPVGTEEHKKWLEEQLLLLKEAEAAGTGLPDELE
jgi:hypothetical protein